MINTKINTSKLLVQNYRNIDNTVKKNKNFIKNTVIIENKKERIKELIENGKYKIDIQNTAKAMAKKLIF